MQPYLNYIFVYDKDDGGFETQLSIRTPLNHPAPRAITINGSYIYIVSPITTSRVGSPKAIRVFNLQGSEQTTLGRSLLPTDNDNPTAIGIRTIHFYMC